MKKLTLIQKESSSGFVLVSVVLLAFVLEGFATISLIQQLQELRTLRYNQMKAAAVYAAQGGIEQGLARLADRIANFSVTDISPDTDYTVTYADGRTRATYRIRCTPPTNASTPLNQCPVTTIVEGGFQKRNQDYEVIGSATNPDSTAFSSMLPITATSKIHQIISAKQTSIFSYAIFYNSDLEVMPGPNMTMTGNIHANGDIYLGVRNGATLTLDSTSIHSTDNFYRTRKDNPSDLMTGTVNMRKSGTSGACSGTSCPTMTLSPLLDSTLGTWGTDATSTWNGSVQSGVHGVGYIQPVTIPSIQPNGFYYNNAGLRVVASNSAVNIYQRNSDGSYSDVTASLPAGTVTNNVAFRNIRENSSYDVKVTDIDLSKLKGTSYFPSNGLIYATRTDAVPATGQTSATSHGVRLINAAEVAPTGNTTGLTVVTNDPLYVKGDFNTTNRKSVALVSDAVNVLSNSWLDSNSNRSISNRVATDTTVNAGFVSGIVPTAGSQYSGGFENYPRFLESWSNKNANISGAFINLWNSQVATGNWPGTGTVYNAPVRNWGYDSGLQSSPPPFTPVGVEVTTKTWWQEAKESLYL